MNDTTPFITKLSTFWGENITAEAVTKVVRIKANMHEWNNNNTVKNDSTSYNSRPEHVECRNTIAEAVVKTARVTANMH